MEKLYSTILLLMLFLANTLGQISELDSMLTSKIEIVPALNEKVSVSVSNTSIQEFMRGVANSSGLNIDVDPGMDIKIVNNFSDVRVLDMLVFLADEYKLKINVIGNIVTVSKDPVETKPQIKVLYDEEQDKLSLDVKDENLLIVSKYITEQTGKNVVPRLKARSEEIQCFIKEMPFDAAIEEMAVSNGLLMEKTENGFYVIEKDKTSLDVESTSQDNSRQRTSRSSRNNNSRSSEDTDDYNIEIKRQPNDSLYLSVSNAPVSAILEELNKKESFNYFVSASVQDNLTGSVVAKDIDLLLTYLFNGTNIAFRKDNNVFIIGEKKQTDFNEHRVVQLQNRSVDQIQEYIPSDLKGSLEITEFPEMNSLVLTGPSYQIEECEKFIKSIDKVVPVILIEVIIMYVDNTITVSTGIEAGIGDAEVTTGGTIFPGVDLTLGASKINEILNGFGWINLGNVSSNFYLTLQALESQGFIDTRSTPKLSTLNGHEATLSIGTTEYYLEESTQTYSSSTVTTTTSEEYKSVEAEMGIKIKPFVSGDEQITLDIEVTNSDFTERISESAPPGSVNRDFISQIRVRNKEMVLLGGLMEISHSDSGSGTPILSRIPIIKWFFSSREKVDEDEKLSILIRPTIIN